MDLFKFGNKIKPLIVKISSLTPTNFFKKKKIEVGGVNNTFRKTDWDKKLVYSLSKSRIPSFQQLKYLKKYLNKQELFIMRISLFMLFASLLFVTGRFVILHVQTIPVTGGKYIEGIVGAPMYINPLYSTANDVDSDLSYLVYSSLFKRGKNGELVNDLVSKYDISADNKEYKLTIRSGVIWHNGSNLTVDDIIFTFNAIKDKQYKSPLRANFDGVEIEKIDEQTIKFILTDSYAAFLELLTFGIMPSEVWSQIQPDAARLAELNLKPIGSGQYKYKQLIKDKSGNIKEYELMMNEDYYGEKPKINFVYRFYPSFEESISALNDGQVDGLSYLSPELKSEIITPKAYNYHYLHLPQITAIFFNQSKNPALAEKGVRQALTYALDKDKIVNDIINNNAQRIDSPVLPESFAFFKDIKKYEYSQEKAAQNLDAAEWKLIPLTIDDLKKAEEVLAQGDKANEKEKAAAEEAFKMGEGVWRKKNDKFLLVKITTVDRNENKQVVDAIKNYWEKIGVKTEIEIIAPNKIQSETIKGREFEALYYGQVLGADPDPYAFWHSSQANEGGINIANFSNKETDQLLEDARLTTNIQDRQEKYKRFQEIIAEELPAIFICSPTYVYLQTNKMKGFDVADIYLPVDRLSNIDNWYLKTGRRFVW